MDTSKDDELRCSAVSDNPATHEAHLFTHIVLCSKVFDEGHHFETGRGVQAACWLVKKENLGSRNELTSDTHTTLLTTTNTFSNGRSNQGLGLVSYTKGIEQELYAVQTLLLRYRAAEMEHELIYFRREMKYSVRTLGEKAEQQNKGSLLQ